MSYCGNRYAPDAPVTASENVGVYTSAMGIAEVLSQIDAELARLQQAKAILSTGDIGTKPGRGRPKGSVAATAAPVRKKRNLSPEGRARIAEAVKRRWAAQKVKKGKS